MGLGLYVHIPFCARKCLYCDFNSYQSKEYLIDGYIGAVLKEAYGYRNADIDTVFMGGGTPTLMSAGQISRLLSGLADTFDLKKGIEFTAEANPGTLDEEKLSMLLHSGVNRLSIGAQSMDDRLLKKLGRIHSSGVFTETFEEARHAGFDNINVDLMFALPDQTYGDWVDTVNKIVVQKPEHVSCYGLTIEDNTPYRKMYERGELRLPDEDTEREMYWNAVSILESNGYAHYEISNFAKKGRECRHNLIYWRDDSYIGLGAGAHSYYKGYRYANEQVPERYIDAVCKGDSPVVQREYIDRRNEMEEYFFMGLRLMKGIGIDDFEHRFGESPYNLYGKSMDRLLKLGLVNIADNRMYLTEKGVDLSNQVFMEFMD